MRTKTPEAPDNGQDDATEPSRRRRSAPYVAVSTDVTKDEGLAALGDIAGYNRHEALGRMVALWSFCRDRGLQDAPDGCRGYAVSEALIRRYLGARGVEAILAEGCDELALGARYGDGLIYLRGTSDTVSALRGFARSARAGGAARAKASRGSGGQFTAAAEPAPAVGQPEDRTVTVKPAVHQQPASCAPATSPAGHQQPTSCQHENTSCGPAGTSVPPTSYLLIPEGVRTGSGSTGSGSHPPVPEPSVHGGADLVRGVDVVQLSTSTVAGLAGQSPQVTDPGIAFRRRLVFGFPERVNRLRAELEADGAIAAGARPTSLQGQGERDLMDRLKESADPAADLDHVIAVVAAEARAKGEARWLGWTMASPKVWQLKLNTPVAEAERSGARAVPASFDAVDAVADQFGAMIGNTRRNQ